MIFVTRQTLRALLRIHKTFSYNFFSMLLNEDVADIEKPDRICSLTFYECLGIFLYPSVFSVID